MNRTDLQACAPDATFRADVLVIGSGPAGATIACELANSSIDVLVIESGGDAIDPALAPLDEIESRGLPRVTDVNDRYARAVGGTSLAWTGRCVAFEPIDFERRDWVPHSGWPIARDALRPFLDRAAQRLRLGPNVYDAALWPLLGIAPPAPALDDAEVVSAFWQYSRDPEIRTRFFDFGREVRSLRAPNVRLLTGATVTHLNTDADGRQMTSVEITDARNRRFTATARAFVLATGGIQNARLMLASDRVVPAGVGNARDQVGRFLMDHPRCTLGEFVPRDVERVLGRFGIFKLRDAAGEHSYSHGLALSPDVQRRERLLNCAAWLTERRAADDPWDAIHRLRRPGRRWRDVRAILAQPRLLAGGARRVLIERRGVVHKIERLLLDCIVEQRPDAESRLTLAERCDPLGVPLPRIDWRISDDERRTVVRFGRAIVEQFACAGLPVPQLVDWVERGALADAAFRDVAHPTGTTRMSLDPMTGVVDAACRVHDVDGLYVAGSSTFPTAGHGNPTLMIVALAARLADELKSTLA